MAVTEAASTHNEIRRDATVLLAFKTNVSVDPQGALQNWKSDTLPCNWTGIACDSGAQCVTNISLSNRQLQGTISLISALPCLLSLDLTNNSFSGHLPPQLGLCLSLTSLSLNNNLLSGPIPLAFGLLQNLQTLHLSNNSLSHPLPHSLGNCTALADLDLSFNSFTGPIPASLSNCSLLTYLDLQTNLLSGQLPQEIGHLTMLRTLSLSSNSLLNGSIPASLGSCAALTEFYSSFTGFSGSLPSALANLSQLLVLDIEQNNLTGQIPEELGNLIQMQVLLLKLNKLTGNIPNTLVNCSSLLWLNLDGNPFTGSIPAEIGKLTKLEDLYLRGTYSLGGGIPSSLRNCSLLSRIFLDRNNLTGPIPFWIGTSLPQLSSWLHLYSNRFSGRIPTTLGNLTQLEHLYLNENLLTGSIPPALGHLTNLVVLELSSNHLTGNVPQELTNLTSLSKLNVSFNNLSGNIPDSLGNLDGLFMQSNQLNGSIPQGLANSSPHLTQLMLGDNKLSGIIPPSLCQLRLLTILSLQRNALTGQIPDCIGACSSLVQILLLSNTLTGSIPATLGNLPVVQVIDLSSNKIQGPIPDRIGTGCKELASLDLSNNRLDGRIPDSLGQLQSLVFFNVSYNSNLSGRIPYSGVFRTLSKSSFLGDSNLCGIVMDTPCPTTLPSMPMPPASSPRRLQIIGGVISGCIVLVIIVTTVICRFVGRSRRGAFSWEGKSFKQVARVFGEDELLIATKGYDEMNIIGLGGFGKVYKGSLLDGTMVAIKKLRLDDAQKARRAFLREVRILTELRHRNLVNILGYCSRPGKEALVLEFMHSGSLEAWLHPSEVEQVVYQLEWESRMNIAVDVAQALAYLHHDCGPVVHGDIKPSNILLDEDMVAHVADFGIAYTMLEESSIRREGERSVFTGTIGYAAPECAETSRAGVKGDVFSYGVVLLEMITGKRPAEAASTSYESRFGECGSLVEWVRRAYEKEEEALYEIVDSRLASMIEEETLTRMVKVAIMCTQASPRKRPSMRHVVDLLMDDLNPSWHVRESLYANLQSGKSASTRSDSF